MDAVHVGLSGQNNVSQKIVDPLLGTKVAEIEYEIRGIHRLGLDEPDLRAASRRGRGMSAKD
jgi:hypothetical protein